MRTTTTASGILAGALLFGSGCGTGEQLDLSKLEVADESKASQISGPSEYLWTRPSAVQVNCVRAPCESHMIYDVNLNRVQLVYAFDLRALNIPPAPQNRLDVTFSNMLLYGRYGTTEIAGEPVRVFQVTRADARVSNASVDTPDDRYYSVRAGDASCQQPPCAAWSAQLLNAQDPASEAWSGIDLSRLQLNQDDQQRLLLDLQNGNAYVSTNNPSVMPVPVTEAFRPVSTLP